MGDPSDRHKAFGSIRDLSHDRELASALGDMIVAWADAEGCLYDIMHRITGMSYAMINDVTARVPTFESRIKITQTLLERWAQDDQHTQALTEAVAKLAKLSATRNRLVHGSWRSTLDKSLTVVFDHREQIGSPKRRRTVKAHDVINHVNAVHSRIDDLFRLMPKLTPKST